MLMPLLFTALCSVTSLVQCLIIIQFVTSAALKAYDVVDFPIFLQTFTAHRALATFFDINGVTRLRFVGAPAVLRSAATGGAG